MAKVSVLIPSRGENLFLQKTIDDIFAKATSELDVIVCLDGWWPDPPLKDNKRLQIVHHSEAKGMRAGINACAAVATGQYLMKCDAHCGFAEGFDEVLKADCDDNWIVIPSRYSLDPDTWGIMNTGKSRVDYHYLTCPMTDVNSDPGMHGREWRDRARERANRPEYDIDETMSMQGSLWFMAADHFHKRLGGMDETGYGTFIQEPQEIGNKTWLGGGKIMTNKRTWYTHLHKGTRFGRGYFIGKDECKRGSTYSTDFWLNNRWPDRIHDFEWFIDRFWPVPTWPENWRELWQTFKGNSERVI